MIKLLTKTLCLPVLSRDPYYVADLEGIYTLVRINILFLFILSFFHYVFYYLPTLMHVCSQLDGFFLI